MREFLKKKMHVLLEAWWQLGIKQKEGENEEKFRGKFKEVCVITDGSIQEIFFKGFTI